MVFLQWSKRKKLLACLGIVAIIALCAVLLKINGFFNILERVPSPNGKIMTTVYRGSKKHGYMDNSISFADTGAVRGSTTCENAAYIGTWWSPNSRYRLEAIRRDGEQELWLTDYKTNTCFNLVSALGRAMYGLPEFQDIRDMEYTFQGWDVYDNVMYFSYTMHTASGEQNFGGFWYDRDEDCIVEID